MVADESTRTDIFGKLAAGVSIATWIWLGVLYVLPSLPLRFDQKKAYLRHVELWKQNEIQPPPSLDAPAHSLLCACYFIPCVGADMDRSVHSPSSASSFPSPLPLLSHLLSPSSLHLSIFRETH